MTKNLKLSFILYSVFFFIIIAWNTLSNMFRGVGISFVATIAILAILLVIYLTDESVTKRTRDLHFTSCIFAILQFITYFFINFGIGGTGVFKFFFVMQNIYAFFSILFFAYTTFRIILEQKNIKLAFVEFILGNTPKTSQKKKSKELINGSLEEKPNTKKEDTEELDEEILKDEISTESPIENSTENQEM